MNAFQCAATSIGRDTVTGAFSPFGSITRLSNDNQTKLETKQKTVGIDENKELAVGANNPGRWVYRD